jgi:hypothetical protein
MVEDMIAAFSTRDSMLRLFGRSKLVMETNVTEFDFCYHTQSIIAVSYSYEIIWVCVVKFPPFNKKSLTYLSVTICNKTVIKRKKFNFKLFLHNDSFVSTEIKSIAKTVSMTE